MKRNDRNAKWALSWVAMAIALGGHVADEALTGFLPLYNETIAAARDSYAWVPFPTFTFPVWLGGLVALVTVLLALTPLVRRGHAWLRPVAYFLGGLMTLNAIGHLAASFWLGRLAPGVYSSPFLLVAAIALLITTSSVRPSGPSAR